MNYVDTSKLDVCEHLEKSFNIILKDYLEFNFKFIENNSYDENYMFWKSGHEASLEIKKMKDNEIDYDNANFGVYKKSHSWYGMQVDDLNIWEAVLLATKVEHKKYPMFHLRGNTGLSKNLRPTPICKKYFKNTFDSLKTYTDIMSIMVAKFPSGRSIPLHRGDRKIRRIHLGLDVPEGDIFFQVRGEKKKWEVGKCLAFNDFYEHTAWNNTDKDRINLIVDIKR